MSGSVHVARVYEDASETVGARILVDRVWPRGMKKEAAGLDDWPKALAPSTELRKWYGHDHDKYTEFRRRYREELGAPEATKAFAELAERARHEPVTLLTATRDLDYSQARVLADLLQERS